MELSVKTLGNLPATVVMSDYDRSAVRLGIVHLSVGNFHRAHQAVYVDRVLALPEQGAGELLVSVCWIHLQKRRKLRHCRRRTVFTLLRNARRINRMWCG